MKNEIKPRPTRQGCTVYRWPKETLAAIYIVFEVTAGTIKSRADLVKEYLPELEMDYAMTTGRQLTNNAINLRYWNADKNGERKSFEHLLDGARAEVGAWLVVHNIPLKTIQE